MVHRGQEGIDPAATELAAYNYDANGNLNGVGYANGVQHAYTYNALNRLTGLGIRRVDILSTSSSPVSLQGYSYTLNKNGHRTHISELSGRSISNTFDALHRLTAESITTSSLITDHCSLGTLSYSYDSVGNRAARTTTGNAALTSLLLHQSQSFTANDRLTSDTYDANGNTTSSSSSSLDSGSLGSGLLTDVYSFDNKLIRRTNGNVVIDLT
jgi:YD repeat-containing protein